MIRAIIVFFSLMFIYFPDKGDISGKFIEYFGYAGAHTLLFYFIFLILKIYSFHIDRLVLKESANPILIIFENSVTLFLSFIIPVFLIRITGLYYFNFGELSVVDLLLILIVLVLLFDFDRYVRKQIVYGYEKNLEKWGWKSSVFFSSYPPKNSSDIIYGATILVALTLVLLSINMLF